MIFLSNKIKWVIAAALVFAALPLAAYLYVQSESFRQTLGDSLSTIVGQTVELGDDIEILSLYPRIGLSLPNAKLRASDAASGLRRARVQNLQVSITSGVLLSGGSKGEVKFSADSLSLITQTGITPNGPADNLDQPTSVVNNAEPLARGLAALLDRLSGLDIELSIADVNYYLRSEQSGNSAYRLSDAQVVSRDDHLQVNANLLEGDEIKHVLSAQVQHSQHDKQSFEKRIAGVMDVQLAAASDQHVSHRLQGTWQVDDNVVKLGAIEYKSDHAWVRGDAAIAYNKPNIVIGADLELRQLDIGAGISGSDNDPQVKPETRLFSYDLFTGDIPQTINAEMRLYLGAIRMDGLPVANGQLHLNLAEGKLNVDSDELFVLGGNADLALQWDNSQSHLVGLRVKFEADDMQLERIRSPGDNDTVLSRGTSDLIVALRGTGPSPAHIASSLNGYVMAAANNVEINQKYTTLMDVGVVSWAIDTLSLLSKDADAERSSARLSDPLAIECASLRLTINDGRVEASNGAIFQFPDNVLYSSGFVDLDSERLGFAFRTKSRSLFDWSAISIAKYAEIGGSLSKPSITLNTKELVKQGVLSASSAAWGPLPSLVYSLAESGLNNMQSSKCKPQIN